MSSANSQDSSNPKPISKGIAGEPPRQLAPSVGNLLVVGASSADISASSARADPIFFGSFEFTPYPPALQSTFASTPEAMELTFGSFNYSIGSEGALRLSDRIPSGPAAAPAAPAFSSASSPTSAVQIASAPPPASTPTSSSATSSSSASSWADETFSELSVGSDDSASSDLTSYYCLDCDVHHDLGSDATPFVCDSNYSANNDNIREVQTPARAPVLAMARYQIFVIDPATGREAKASTSSGSVSVSQAEWDASQHAMSTTLACLLAYHQER